jgi:hypothetical protein
MQAKTKAEGMDGAAHSNLGLHSCAADAPHILAAELFGNAVQNQAREAGRSIKPAVQLRGDLRFKFGLGRRKASG